jgi:hypothetical protein
MTRRTVIRSALMAVTLATMIAPTALAQASEAPSSAAPPASLAPGSDATLLGSERGPVAAGSYVDRSLGRDISFSLDEGWVSDGATEGAGIALIREEPGSPYFAISPFPGQVFPEGCVTDSQDPEAFFAGATDLEISAAAFIDHVANHPAITAGAPVPVELGGYSGLQLDISGVDVDDSCMPPWAWLWVLPVVGDYHLNEGEVARIVALDADGQVIVAVMEAFPEADYEAFLARSMGVLESLEIGPLAD